MIERANALNIDTSGFQELATDEEKADLTARLSSWANAIEMGNYRLDSGGAGRWLSLLWMFVDVVNEVAADVDASWS